MTPPDDRPARAIVNEWGIDWHNKGQPIVLSPEQARDLTARIAAAIPPGSREAMAEAVAEAVNYALDAAASIVENVPHSCLSDEHCCALHQAHKRAAADIRARKVTRAMADAALGQSLTR